MVLPRNTTIAWDITDEKELGNFNKCARRKWFNCHHANVLRSLNFTFRILVNDDQFSYIERSSSLSNGRMPL
jgi:hypothetical protein